MSYVCSEHDVTVRICNTCSNSSLPHYKMITCINAKTVEKLTIKHKMALDVGGNGKNKYTHYDITVL